VFGKARILIISVLIFVITFSAVSPVLAENEDTMELSAKSAIMIEQSSGKIIYEKNIHQKLPLASVTKVMTMLLIMEAIDADKIKLNDIITVSDYASSATGSRVFLSKNEKITVRDLIKSIAVASGNDAAICMAEHISGSEANFVKLMNTRAGELGMKNTHFANCNGLDAPEHYSSAFDISIMSAELLRHDKIREYLKIWMDSLRDGTFTLANTNKVVC